MLAHVASFQGEMVAELIAGHKRAYDPVAVPAIVFTEPEIVSVGLSPEKQRGGHPVITGNSRWPPTVARSPKRPRKPAASSVSWPVKTTIEFSAFKAWGRTSVSWWAWTLASRWAPFSRTSLTRFTLTRR